MLPKIPLAELRARIVVAERLIARAKALVESAATTPADDRLAANLAEFSEIIAQLEGLVPLVETPPERRAELEVELPELADLDEAKRLLDDVRRLPGIDWANDDVRRAFVEAEEAFERRALYERLERATREVSDALERLSARPKPLGSA